MTTTPSNDAQEPDRPLKIGVLSLQGAFEEHQACLEALGCLTEQVKTPAQLSSLDGIIFPGGESTAMGLIGSHQGDNLWTALQSFVTTQQKPTWGTCAGMILLAEKCVGTSAVIEEGQSLIGGLDVVVCRNYFGSQISSFELATPPPPPPSTISSKTDTATCDGNEEEEKKPFPGVFIRAPAILAVGEGVHVLGQVVATPCRKAAVVLRDLEERLARGEDVSTVGVVVKSDATKKASISLGETSSNSATTAAVAENDTNDEEKKDSEGTRLPTTSSSTTTQIIKLPGAAEGTEAREVICAVRKDNVLCTAFHPEIADDLRWHRYFVNMVRESLSS